MQRTTLAMVFLGFAPIALGTAWAGANCAQVNKYLATGRSVQDVAETMVLSEDDVKKCQAEAKDPKAGGGSKPAGGGGAAPPESGQGTSK